MPVYNKLIRDKIPAIIHQTGKSYQVKTLSAQEYRTELRKKGREELEEYMQAEDDRSAVEELADLMEVIYALSEVHGSSTEELEEIRKRKAEERGGFQEKLFLIEVEDD
ncbi:MAG: nucleoside triphosphate pyrophosphohydrolase [Bacillaceae bacterium]|nr:nucleoside triphosphate pyrophosphohydrolase [Bacillaceae bacterium]